MVDTNLGPSPPAHDEPTLGRDRPRGSWRRRLGWTVRWIARPFLLVVAVAVVAVAVVLVLGLTRSVASRSVCAMQAWSDKDVLLTCDAPNPQPAPPKAVGPVQGHLTVGVDVGSQQTRVIEDLDLPKQHPLVALVVNGSLDARRDYSLLDQIFEGVLVKEGAADDWLGFWFADLTIEYSPDSDRAQLHATSEPIELPAADYELRFDPPGDESITVEHVRVVSPEFRLSAPPGSTAPASMQAGHVRFVEGTERQLRLHLSRPLAPEAPPDGSLVGLMGRAYRANLPVAGIGLMFAAYSVPLLAWLLLARRAQREEPRHDWLVSPAATAVFASVVTTTLLVAAEVLQGGSSWTDDVQQVLQALANWLPNARMLPRFDDPNAADLLVDASAVMAVLALGVVVPFVIRQRQPRPWGIADSRWRVLLRRLWTLSLAVLLCLPVAVVATGLWAPDTSEKRAAMAMGNPHQAGVAGRPLLVLGLVLGLALAASLLTVLPPWRAVLGTAIGMLAVADLVLLADLIRPPSAAGRVVPGAVLFATGFWLLFTYAGVGVAMASHLLGSAGWQWWQKAGVGLAIAVLAWPHRVLLDRPLWEDVRELATASTRLLWMVAVVWIVATLRGSSQRHGPRLPENALWLGLLLSVLTVFRPTFRFFYLPVTSLVGVALLRYWLYQRPPAPVEDGRTANAEVREELLEAGAELRWLEKHVEQVRRQAQTDSDRGEIPSEKRSERVQVAAQELADARSSQRRRFGVAANEVALNIGPCPRPWESARLGAICAAGFALPMIVLYVRRVASYNFAFQFPILWLAIPLLEQVISWVAIGFLFGYFYTAIRGRTGLQKGLWVAVALIVPRAVYTVLVGAVEPDAWPAFGLWATEVAVLSLVLGLAAGDLGTLSSVRWPWRRLRDLQEVGWLAGWASSLAVALGGVIVSLLSGALASFIQQSLRISRGP